MPHLSPIENYEYNQQGWLRFFFLLGILESFHIFPLFLSNIAFCNHRNWKYSVASSATISSDVLLEDNEH